MFFRLGGLKFFVILTGKNLCWSVFFKKLQALGNFIKKETPTQLFSCECCERFKNRLFIEHLRWLHLKRVFNLFVATRHYKVKDGSQCTKNKGSVKNFFIFSEYWQTFCRANVSMNSNWNLLEFCLFLWWTQNSNSLSFQRFLRYSFCQCSCYRCVIFFQKYFEME